MTGLELDSRGRPFGASRGLLAAGAVAAFLCLGGGVLDVATGMAAGADLLALPAGALERFAELRDRPLLGLYRLDLLNALIQVLMLPVYLSLSALHRGRGSAWARLGERLYLLGTALFLAGNAALPMLQLAARQAQAATEAERAAIAAAGEALLSRGAHGSLGAFPAFLLATLAALSMSAAMLAGGLFSRPAAWIGLAGNALLLVYLVLVAFVPAAKGAAMALAMPGGLLALAWILLTGARLAALARRAGGA